MAEIINRNHAGFEFKKHPIISDPKPVLVSRSFQLFDVAGKVFLKKEESIANFLAADSGMVRSRAFTASGISMG
jgi:hypothetical protein